MPSRPNRSRHTHGSGSGSKSPGKSGSQRKSGGKSGGKSRKHVRGEHTLRIIGGSMRGRPLRTIDDLRTRPMKDRVREAVFNLVGPAIKGKHGIDLFAGSGALGLESLSRGAAHATLIERHFPTADLIRENVRALDVEQRADVVAADAFLWARLDLPEPTVPWVVFCSPPYDFYVDRGEDMVQLIERLRRSAPDGSRIVVESDLRFDTDLLPLAEAWDVRTYGQARVSLLITPEGKASCANPAPPVG